MTYVYFFQQAVVNIGEVDFSLGLSYVALSRVRSLNDLLIEPFLYDRLKPSARTTANIEIRKDFLKELTEKQPSLQ